VSALEKHYSVGDLAALWQLSSDTVRNIFRDHPGVLKLDSPERLRKRGYCVLRIPESVAQKVHEQLRGNRRKKESQLLR
jgi:hypothetical protein